MAEPMGIIRDTTLWNEPEAVVPGTTTLPAADKPAEDVLPKQEDDVDDDFLGSSNDMHPSDGEVQSMIDTALKRYG